MAWGAGFRRPVDYGKNRAVASESYNQLSNARQKVLDAEVQAAWREYEKNQTTATDKENLAAIGVQAAAAYYDGRSANRTMPETEREGGREGERERERERGRERKRYRKRRREREGAGGKRDGEKE